MARDLVTRYGMSELGPRTFGHKTETVFLGKEIQEERNYSEKTAENIDKQVTKFIQGAYQTTENILKEKGETLEKITKALLEKETLEQEEFNQIVGIVSKEETVSEKSDNEKTPSAGVLKEEKEVEEVVNVETKTK